MNNDDEFLPTLDDLPSQLLWSAFKLWQQHRKAGLQELGLTHAQFITLASLLWLSKRNPHVTQAMIAHRSKIDVMHVSRIVRSLEKKGLLDRRPSPDDIRANDLEITSKGEKVAIKGLARVDATVARFFRPIKSREKEFVSLMKTLIQVNDIELERSKRK